MKVTVEAWGKGDPAPLYAALHDDIVWNSAASEWDERISSGGRHRGRAEVVALLTKIAAAYFVSSCKAREVFSRADAVWGLFDLEGSYCRATGQSSVKPVPIRSELVFRWRIEDGKITHAQTFLDTAALLAQQQGEQTLAI